jgi:hypothetical protein
MFPTGHEVIRSFVCATLGLLLPLTLSGQSERGTITGAVHDASGAVVPNAKVAAVNQSTNVSISAVTNDSGEYTLPSLQAGVYAVKV